MGVKHRRIKQLLSVTMKLTISLIMLHKRYNQRELRGRAIQIWEGGEQRGY